MQCRARRRTRTCGLGRSHDDLSLDPPSELSRTVRPVQRLRPLSEEECYLRCYGFRGGEDTVKVVRKGDGVITESPAVLTERIRLAFEARFETREHEAA